MSWRVDVLGVDVAEPVDPMPIRDRGALPGGAGWFARQPRQPPALRHVSKGLLGPKLIVRVHRQTPVPKSSPRRGVTNDGVDCSFSVIGSQHIVFNILFSSG